MTKKTYICNFCRDEYAAGRAEDDIFGVYWGPDNQTLSYRYCSSVETHICKTCLLALGAIAGEVGKAVES